MMDNFRNVTIVKKANVFFDGSVVSRTVLFSDGTKKTLGFMQQGEYKFDTADRENMEIYSGSLDLLLPGADQWKRVSGGESFEIPAGATFTVKVVEPLDYCCSYTK